MTEFVKSLQRLYTKNILKIEQLKKLLKDKKISEEEFDYITRKEG